MKFSCTQENLLRGLSLVSHVTSRNVNLPILHNILLRAQENGIELVATNLEMGIRVLVRGKVEAVGSFTVPAQVFLNYISLVTADRIDAELVGNDLCIQAGNQKTKIRGEGAQEFPLLPEIEKKHGISVETGVLKQALRQTLIAVSHDDSRPELTGVYCVAKENTFTLASTDSYRLAERSIPTAAPVETERSVIIPASTLSELVRLLPDGDERIELYLHDNQLLCTLNDMEMTSRLIEGVFPEYQAIIPTSEQTTVVVNREQLMQAVKAASLFSRSGIHDMNLHFSPEQKVITLTTVNNHVGENITKVDAEITGESNNTVFNFRYLLDGLASFSTADVSIHLLDNVHPGIFRPHGSAASAQSGVVQQYLYIIMPIKQ